MNLLARLDEVYRRSGANLPFGDPVPSHGAEMEGYFWRITDVAHQSVLVVLCGVNRHPDGDWATVAIAAHPGGFVRSAGLDGAHAASDRCSVTAGNGAFAASPTEVHIDLGDGAKVDFTVTQPVLWPRPWGGGGVFSMVPFLGQYWHPHLLGGVAQGHAAIGSENWAFEGADLYAEKNWGAGFPERWWWGQAQGFDRPDVCVAFGGGLLTAGPLSVTVGGVVVRVGAHVLRFTPPLSIVRAYADGRRWEVSARGHGSRVRIVGEGMTDPHVLPVPLPAQRRNIDTDLEHLAAHLTLEVTGRIQYQGETHLAGLEIGHRPTSTEMSRTSRP